VRLHMMSGNRAVAEHPRRDSHMRFWDLRWHWCLTEELGELMEGQSCWGGKVALLIDDYLEGRKDRG
jgi:hypothetical protein